MLPSLEFEKEPVLKKDERGNWYLPDDRPEMVWPIRAPRLRAALTGALSRSQMSPRISVFETAWLIRESGDKRGDWHKDRQGKNITTPGVCTLRCDPLFAYQPESESL